MARKSSVAIPRRPGEKMVTRNMWLPEDFDTQIANEAAERQLSFADLVVEAFSMRLKPHFPDTPTERRQRASRTPKGPPK